MKKTASVCVAFLLVLAFATPNLSAAPTDDEVAASFTGVFGVYGAVFLVALMGGELPDNAVVNTDMNSGAVSMVFTDLDTKELFSLVGEGVQGEGDMPAIPFTHVSGSFITNSEGDLVMNVSLTGGPVKSLYVESKGEEFLQLNADGKDYLHLKDSLMSMGM